VPPGAVARPAAGAAAVNAMAASAARIHRVLPFIGAS
jgi:hypothetical protein